MKIYSLVLLVLVSCVDNVDEGPVDDPVSDDTVFYQTVAHASADGVVFDDPQPITAKQQRLMAEARMAHERGEVHPSWTPTQDGACAGTSLWLFDRTDYSGNEICFTGCGVADLTNYVRTYRGVDGRLHVLGTWRITSGSYWPGDRPGALGTVTNGSPAYFVEHWFTAWGARAAFNYAPDAYLWAVGVGFSYAGEPCP